MRAFFTAAIVCFATPTFSEGTWSDREICRAATKTYFWLNEFPNDAPDKGMYMGFRSERQNYYTCRVDGEIADFYWLNDSSEKMTSRSTRIKLFGNELKIITDLSTEAFTK